MPGNLPPMRTKNAKVLDNLIIKTDQMLIRDFDLYDYEESKLLTMGEWRPTNGAFYVIWNDYFEGSSTYNKDVYNTATTGESKSALDPYADVTIADINAKTNVAYESMYYTDFNWSRKLLLPSSILNNFTFTMAQYAAVVQAVKNQLRYALNKLQFQRTLGLLLLSAKRLVPATGSEQATVWMYDEVDTTYTYNSIFGGPKVGTTGTKWTQAEITQNLKDIINMVNNDVYKIQQGSRTHLKNTWDGTHKIYYVGAKRQFTLLIDYRLRNTINVNLISGVFQLQGVQWPSNVTIKYVNTGIYSENISDTTVTNPLWLETDNNIDQTHKYPYMWLIDNELAKQTVWYEGETSFDGPKFYRVITHYLNMGFVRMPKAYAKVYCFKKQPASANKRVVLNAQKS